MLRCSCIINRRVVVSTVIIIRVYRTRSLQSRVPSQTRRDHLIAPGFIYTNYTLQDAPARRLHEFSRKKKKNSAETNHSQTVTVPGEIGPFSRMQTDHRAVNVFPAVLVGARLDLSLGTEYNSRYTLTPCGYINQLSSQEEAKGAIAPST